MRPEAKASRYLAVPRSEGKNKSRSPAGMTERKTNASGPMARQGLWFDALGLGRAGEAGELDAAREALWREDAKQGAVLNDGEDAGGAEGGGMAECIHELLGGLGDGEITVHGGLEEAVAVDLETGGEGVAGDGADEAVAADDGEDVVETVGGLREGAAEGVGAGEQGVLGEHDVGDKDGAGLDGVERWTHAELAPEKHQAAKEDEPDV